MLYPLFVKQIDRDIKIFLSYIIYIYIYISSKTTKYRRENPEQCQKDKIRDRERMLEKVYYEDRNKQSQDIIDLKEQNKANSSYIEK